MLSLLRSISPRIVTKDNHQHLAKIHDLTLKVQELQKGVQEAEVRGLFVCQGALTFSMGVFGLSTAAVVATKVARLMSLFLGVFGFLSLLCAVVIPYLIPAVCLDINEYKNSMYSGLFFSGVAAICAVMAGATLGIFY